MKRTIIALSLAALLAACQNKGSGNDGGSAQSAGQITGAGSTFVYPVLSAWAADYKKQGGADINYQSIGSGGGITSGQGRHRRFRRQRPAARAR